MKILKIKEFDLNNQTAVVDLMGDGLGSVSANQVSIQIDEDCELSILGKIIDSCELEPIALIKLEDLSVISDITEPGIYLGEVSAFTAIALEGTGKATLKVLTD